MTQPRTDEHGDRHHVCELCGVERHEDEIMFRGMPADTPICIDCEPDGDDQFTEHQRWRMTPRHEMKCSICSSWVDIDKIVSRGVLAICTGCDGYENGDRYHVCELCGLERHEDEIVFRGEPADTPICIDCESYGDDNR